ncbi:GTP cyclohydrolase I [Catellatospora citrea]|nr:GTP cyclohydrolase I [Catellatospora citrea]
MIDQDAAERAAAALLTALGVPLDTPSTQRTPARMVKAYAELLTPREYVPTVFPNEAGYRELVLARQVPFVSLCAHHMLPFVGTAHLGYLPGERILGLSKLARLLSSAAARPQIQEVLTQQLGDWLESQLKPGGAAVVVTAEHMCMTLRGAGAMGSTVTTSTWRGSLADPAARAQFMAMAGEGAR